MKPMLTLGCLILSCSLHASIIEKLSAVESGNDDRAVGSRGELGRWQMMWFVRKSYPGVNWRDPVAARRAVVQELNTRSATFCLRHGRWPTEFEQALLWRCPARVSHPDSADVAYAIRVSK